MHALFQSHFRVNVVAFDFLGHGESPHPHQPDLYTANEVINVIGYAIIIMLVFMVFSIYMI